MELKKLKGKRYSLFLIVNISLFFVYNISFKFRIIRHVFEHHNVIKFRFTPRRDALKTYCKELVFVKFDNSDFKSKNSTNMKKLASRLKLTRTNLFGALFNKNKPNFDNNSFYTTITYDIIGADVPSQELQFALQSTR